MKLSCLFSVILSAALLGACSDSDNPLPVPPELSPDDVLINSTSHYNRWVDADGTVEIHASSQIAAPAGATVSRYVLEVDGKPAATCEYPATSGITLYAADYGHGRHMMNLIAVVEDGTGCSVLKPVFEDGSFVVFDVIPDIDIAASLDVHVTSVATSGEKYDEQFTVESTADGRLRLPKDKFSWIPANGSASGLDVNLTISSRYSELPEGLEGAIECEQWNLASEESVAGNAVKLYWSNPVKFEEWHGLTPSCLLKYKGTYEGIELNDSTINGFVVVLE